MTYRRLKPFFPPTKCKTTAGSHFPQSSESHAEPGTPSVQCALGVCDVTTSATVVGGRA